MPLRSPAPSPAPTPSGGPRLLVGLAVALGTLALAPAADAAFVGEATDPAGDATAPEGARDIVAAGFGYDRVDGRMIAAVALRDTPSDPSGAVVVAYAGRRSPTGCDRAPTVGLTTLSARSSASWLRFDQPDVVAARGTGAKSVGGRRVQRLEATDRRLAGLRPDCAVVSLTPTDGSRVVYDSVTFALRATANLGLKVDGVPTTVRRGRTHALRIVLSNTGDAPTVATRVRLKRIAGVAMKRSHRVAAIAPGRSRTVRVPVRISRRAGGTEHFDVTATSGPLKASVRRRMYVRRGAVRGGRSGSGTPSVCSQYFPDFFGGTGGSLGLVPCVR